MNDLEKQQASWIKSAKSDLDTAALLINEARLIEGLFFCLLSIEKGLKAHVIKHTTQSPADCSDLMELLYMAHIHVGEKDKELLGILMSYQTELRYPEHDEVLDITFPTANQAFDYLDRTRELLKWLEKTL